MLTFFGSGEGVELEYRRGTGACPRQTHSKEIEIDDIFVTSSPIRFRNGQHKAGHSPIALRRIAAHRSRASYPLPPQPREIVAFPLIARDLIFQDLIPFPSLASIS